MFLGILVVIATLFMVSYVSIPQFMKLLDRIGLKGTDVHKLERPHVVESGGVILLTILPLSLLFLYFLIQKIEVLYPLAIALPFGIFGFADDLKTLGKYEKLGASFVVAFFGSYLLFHSSFQFLPFLVAALLLVVGSNMFNWFAGLNGVEFGTSLIITAFLALNLFLLDKTIPLYLALVLLFTLLPLLKYNKYPASIFPGDSGTLFIGAYLTSLALFFNLWNVFLPLLSLHILNALLKFFSAGYFSYSEKKPTKIEEDGKLTPRGGFLSVIRLILNFRRMEEKRVVQVIWVLTIIIGILTTIFVQGGLL